MNSNLLQEVQQHLALQPHDQPPNPIQSFDKKDGLRNFRDSFFSVIKESQKAFKSLINKIKNACWLG